MVHNGFYASQIRYQALGYVVARYYIIGMTMQYGFAVLLITLFRRIVQKEADRQSSVIVDTKREVVARRISQAFDSIGRHSKDRVI
jgi:hypothetical protein